MKRPTILLMHGYIGFGKTTVAKKFEELGYIRYNHDDWMSRMFGDVLSNEDFVERYNIVYDAIIKAAFLDVKAGKNIILDFGFWSKEDRRKIWNIITSWDKDLDILPSIIWCNVRCDINKARQRCIDRDKNRKNGELWVPVEVFDAKLEKFEPMDQDTEFERNVISFDN